VKIEHIIKFLLITLVVTLPLYFDTTMFRPFDTPKFFALMVLTICLFICVMIDPSHLKFKSPISYPIIALWVVTCFSTFFSVHPMTSLIGGSKRFDGLVSFSAYVFIFFVVINYATRRMVDILIEAIIWTCFIVCEYGACQQAGLEFFEWIKWDTRVFSTLGHPGFLAAFIVMVLPLVIYRALTKHRLYALLIPFYLAVMIFTRTRASFVGLIVSMAVLGWFMRKRILTNWRKSAICAVVIVVLFSIFAKPLIVRFASEIDIREHQHGTAGPRIIFAQIGIDIVKDYPLCGIGPDTLGFVYLKYLEKLYPAGIGGCARFNQSRIHNDFIDMAVSRGLIGLAVYIWLIVSFVRMVRSRCDNIAVLCVSMGLLSYIVQNQFSFGHISFIIVFWVYMGMAVVLCRENGKRNQTKYKKCN
jgi:O-antigen ligase